MSGNSFCDCQVQEGPRGWGVSGGMRGDRRHPSCEIPEDFRGKKRRGREGAWRIEHLRMFVIRTSLPFFGSQESESNCELLSIV